MVELLVFAAAVPCLLLHLPCFFDTLAELLHGSAARNTDVSPLALASFLAALCGSSRCSPSKLPSFATEFSLAQSEQLFVQPVLKCQLCLPLKEASIKHGCPASSFVAAPPGAKKQRFGQGLDDHRDATNTPRTSQEHTSYGKST